MTEILDPRTWYSSSAIGLILDPEFGDRLYELPDYLSVWIVDGVENARAVQTLRQLGSASRPADVTTFTVDISSSRERDCIRVLNDIDLHHGDFSSIIPYQAVIVWGVSLTDEIEQAFAKYGSWSFFNHSEDGFAANRTFDVS